MICLLVINLCGLQFVNLLAVCHPHNLQRGGGGGEYHVSSRINHQTKLNMEKRKGKGTPFGTEKGGKPKQTEKE